ncbi:MAG TPA: PorV/PorQ family protein [bacterium]|nr:PorV/PorQ family protein [bacterium]
MLLQTKKKLLVILLLAGCLILSVNSVSAQIRAGGVFLKMLPGARNQSMATTSAAELTDIHSLFSNPAATSFFREWQWAASYSKWIADVYHAGFVYNTNLRSVISHRTRLAVGFLYQGVPEFDSSDGATEAATANDMIVALSLGQPLPGLSNHIGIGANVKYFRSNLNGYSDDVFIFDVGVLAKTSRFKLNLPLLPHAILSAGAAITQLGNRLTFESSGTPLPLTLRSGLAFYAGSHSGIQLQLSGDYYQIKDEGNALSVGFELGFAHLFSLNGGYNFNSDLMEKFSLGGTIRLDDFRTGRNMLVPGRNKGLKLEIASIDEGEFFARTYRGGLNHFPVMPEYFEFVHPAQGDTIADDQVMLKWQPSRDPDIFDHVRYTLLMSDEKIRLEKLIQLYQQDVDLFFATLRDSAQDLVATAKSSENIFQLTRLKSGDHYWVVFAEDENQHLRFARRGHQSIAHFFVPSPDLKIRDIKFKHSPWITLDDYHGEIELSIENMGSIVAENFMVIVSDSALPGYQIQTGHPSQSEKAATHQFSIETLEPSAIKNITFPWRTVHLGAHVFSCMVDPDNIIDEADEDNNQQQQIFHTIPKGYFSTEDSVCIVELELSSIDIPLVTQLFFDANDWEVKPDYLASQGVAPIIPTLGKRLRQHQDLRIQLQGFADPNSETATAQLAKNRALAVRDSLILFGANEHQITILQEKTLPRRRTPAKPQDARWVFEERRLVQIYTTPAAEFALFQPVREVHQEKKNQPVQFSLHIQSAIPTVFAAANFAASRKQISLPVDVASHLNLTEAPNWKIEDSAVEQWLHQPTSYQITLKDSLDRTFKTKPKTTWLTESSRHLSHRIVLPMTFAKTDPLYDFYWSLILKEAQDRLNNPDWRFRFTGHACAVGSDAINQRLSVQRVNRFDNRFRQYIKSHHADIFQQLSQRLDSAQGFGESQPLSALLASGEHALIGDNHSPIGRTLNRRIEVEFMNRGHY